MTSLEQHQRGMLALYKNRASAGDDPYLARVEASPALAMMRKIGLWWISLSLEKQCPLSARLLKRLGRFDYETRQFFSCNAVPSFIEDMSILFLEHLAFDERRPVAAVAQFELAVILVGGGRAVERRILWDRNPEEFILALDTEASALPEREEGARYWMRVYASSSGVRLDCVRSDAPSLLGEKGACRPAAIARKTGLSRSARRRRS